MMGGDTRVFPDAVSLAEGTAALILHLLKKSLEQSGGALVVLSGGSTPRACYSILAAGLRDARVPVENVLWAFGDERWVPVGHPDSNEGMARATLLGPAGVPEQCILSWQAGSGDPLERAAQYARRLAGLRPAVTLLGIGDDGHTASLISGATAFLPDGRKLPVSMDLSADAAAVWVPVRPQTQSPAGGRGVWRLTLCPAYLNRSRTAVFLVSGAAKLVSLSRAAAEDPSVPASWVRGQDTVFMVTRDTLPESGPDHGRDVRMA